MVIYFKDGLLDDENIPECDFTVEAGFGISSCKACFRCIRTHMPNSTVYTNSILALDSMNCWDEKSQQFSLYLEDGSDWKPIDNFTNRTLRPGSNLKHLYLNGEFEKEVLI